MATDQPKAAKRRRMTFEEWEKEKADQDWEKEMDRREKEDKQRKLAAQKAEAERKEQEARQALVAESKRVAEIKAREKRDEEQKEKERGPMYELLEQLDEFADGDGKFDLNEFRRFETAMKKGKVKVVWDDYEDVRGPSGRNLRKQGRPCDYTRCSKCNHLTTASDHCALCYSDDSDW
jgi:hypothetical protein